MDKFSQMLGSLSRRKAYYQYFINDLGMDEMEFTELESNMNDLGSEYVVNWGYPAYYEEGEDDSEDGYIS